MNAPEPTGLGVYLYGFARPGMTIGAGIRGIDGRADVVERPIGPGVAAIYSAIAIEDLAPLLAPDRPPDPEWIVPRACRHERAIETVMARSPVLPVRFGTVFTSEAALREHTEHRHPAIADFLERVTGKEEWDVKISLDLGAAIAWLLEHDPEWSARSRRLPATPGARYFQQKALERSARPLALDRSQRLAESMIESLRTRCESLSYGQGAGSGSPTAAGGPLLRAALLLPSRCAGELLEHLESLAAPVRQSGLMVKASGPWPPYHFCPHLDGDTTYSFTE